jgi:hypothetical protein
MQTSLTTAGALACALALPASASTYVVDASGAPGTDFTSIVSAISAAVDGDVLIVRAGAYEPIHLDEALTILCDPDVSSPVLHVHSLLAGEVAVVSGLATLDIDLVGCAGTVILDKVSADNSYYLVTSPARPTLNVASSADVRIYRSTFIADNYAYGSFFTPGDDAVVVSGSRVELVRCTVRGGSRGIAQSCYPGQYSSGGAGILVGALSDVHVALSSVWGGRGSGLGFSCDADAGDGGPAICVRGNSSVIVAGVPGDVIRGGRPGDISFSLYGNPGVRGAPLQVDAGCNARYSGCTFGAAPMIGPTSAFTLAVPADPTLERLGDGAAGSNVSIIVHGASGWSADLDRGRQPIVVPGAGPIPTLVQALASFQLGVLPPSGTASKLAAISPLDPAGTLYVWQGITSSPALQERRTNSVPVIVR